jgi:hypothetical protein
MEEDILNYFLLQMLSPYSLCCNTDKVNCSHGRTVKMSWKPNGRKKGKNDKRATSDYRKHAQSLKREIFKVEAGK